MAVPNHDGICGLARNNILDLPPHHVSHWSEKTMRHVAKQYNLKLLSLNCEAIAEFHKTWGAQSIYEQQIRDILGYKSGLIDDTIFARLISKIAAILNRIGAPDLTAVNGHTVLACYQKEN